MSFRTTVNSDILLLHCTGMCYITNQCVSLACRSRHITEQCSINSNTKWAAAGFYCITAVRMRSAIHTIHCAAISGATWGHFKSHFNYKYYCNNDTQYSKSRQYCKVISSVQQRRGADGEADYPARAPRRTIPLYTWLTLVWDKILNMTVNDMSCCHLCMRNTFLVIHLTVSTLRCLQAFSWRPSNWLTTNESMNQTVNVQ